MKSLLLLLLNLYQRILSPALHQLLGVQNACRYSPTCSEYARIAIIKHGVLKGSMLGIRRLLSCQPWINLKI